jgi:hypothetical protein
MSLESREATVIREDDHWSILLDDEPFGSAEDLGDATKQLIAEGWKVWAYRRRQVDEDTPSFVATVMRKVD